MRTPRVHLRIQYGRVESLYACGVQRSGRTISSVTGVDKVTCFACRKTKWFKDLMDPHCWRCGVSYLEKPRTQKVQWDGKWQCKKVWACERRRKHVAHQKTIAAAMTCYQCEMGDPHTHHLTAEEFFGVVQET